MGLQEYSKLSHLTVSEVPLCWTILDLVGQNRDCERLGAAREPDHVDDLMLGVLPEVTRSISLLRTSNYPRLVPKTVDTPVGHRVSFDLRPQ